MTGTIIRYTAFLVVAGLIQIVSLRAQPDEILLNHSKIFGHSRQNPVRFPHGEHLNDFDCLDCHHRYVNKKNILNRGELVEGAPAAKCTTCHNPQSDCKLQTFFHKLCLGCHLELQKAGRKSGPRLCIDCHPKEPFVIKGGPAK
jgi:hypothetical protein